MKRLRLFFVGTLFVFLPMTISAQEVEVAETDSVSSADDSLDEDIESISMDSASVKSYTTLSLPIDSLSDSLVVAVYRSGWDSARVNPYRFPIDSIQDSFVVDCRGFYPPNINVVTSECGERWGRFHAGTDMRLTIGDTIRAAFDGKVRVTRSNASKKKGYGYFVMIQHANGLETLYAHLSKVLVKNNQNVKAGEPIGLGGNTGRSTGPHLHFEFRFLGNPINTRNLLEITADTMYMKADTYTITKKGSFKEFYAFLHSPAKYHKVRSGDCLGKIARRYHTTVKQLCRLNHIKPTTTLRIGRKLRVR